MFFRRTTWASRWRCGTSMGWPIYRPRRSPMPSPRRGRPIPRLRRGICGGAWIWRRPNRSPTRPRVEAEADTRGRVSPRLDYTAPMSGAAHDANDEDQSPLAPLTSEIDEPRPDERHNFLTLVVYNVLMRTGWIFKTESSIMPAVLDSFEMLGTPRWAL